MKPCTFLRVVALASCVLAAAIAQAQPRTSGPGGTPPAGELLQRLRAGGYTIHFRHAITDLGENDTGTASDEDCRRQRNLSAAGRAQARAIGEAIRALDMPIGAVLAGPLCRTMETARLMFGRAQSDWDVRGGGLGRRDYPGLRRLIATPVPAGNNRVLVGHGGQFQFVSGMSDELAEGEAAVIRGLGEGRFEIVARLRPVDWERLRSARAPLR